MKTRLPLTINQIVKAETEKINKLFLHISRPNIRELNKLIAVAKVVYEKVGVLLKNTNRNSKLGWKIWLETKIRKSWQQAKMITLRQNTWPCWEEKKKSNKGKINNATSDNKSEGIGEREMTKKIG